MSESKEKGFILNRNAALNTSIRNLISNTVETLPLALLLIVDFTFIFVFNLRSGF